jgi:hypothetical protein
MRSRLIVSVAVLVFCSFAAAQDGGQKIIKIVIGPDGKAQIISDQETKKPAPVAGVEQKLDQILKQLGELRGDVDAIKKRLDGMQSGGFGFGFPGGKPGKGPPFKEKKLEEPKTKGELPKEKKPTIDPEVQERLDAIIKALEKGKPPVISPFGDRPRYDAEVQKRIEEILKSLKAKEGGKEKVEFELDGIFEKLERTLPPRTLPAPSTAQRIAELERMADDLRRQIDKLKARGDSK